MINFLKDKFPVTLKLLPSILFGAPFLGVNYQWLSIKFPDIVLSFFFWTGIILIGLPIIVFILELLSKLFPILKVLLNIIIKVTNYFLNIYIWIIKFLIKKAVVSIMEEKKNLTSEQFTLKNSQGSDEYWSRNLDFLSLHSLELIVKPKQGSKYWRLGLKFSGNNIFSAAKHSSANPLFHLTKDTGSNDLKADYYNESEENGTIRGIQVIPSYRDTEIKVKVRLGGDIQKIKLYVFNHHNYEVYQKDLDISLHRYARLFAWGDGKEYEIHIKNIVETE